MTTTNYTEKARERRAADKRLREAAGDMAEALKGLLREAPPPHKDIRKSFSYVLYRESAKRALLKAGVSL